MALVTLTSDLGTKDYYLAVLKGAILSHCGYVPMVDISHSVKPFDIKEGAFLIKNSYHHFPKGAIHTVHVNTNESKNKLVVAEVEGHHFITFNTGIFSLMFGSNPVDIFYVNEELLDNNSLLCESAIAKVIDLLLKEYRVNDFGHPANNDMVSYRLIQPITSPGTVRGTVIYIDHFGNAVVNISQKIFDEFIGDKKFTVTANVGSVKNFSENYSETEEGDMFCLFNSAGYLEVGINKGKAEQLLGLKTGSSVLVFAD